MAETIKQFSSVENEQNPDNKKPEVKISPEKRNLMIEELNKSSEKNPDAKKILEQYQENKDTIIEETNTKLTTLKTEITRRIIKDGEELGSETVSHKSSVAHIDGDLGWLTMQKEAQISENNSKNNSENNSEMIQDTVESVSNFLKNFEDIKISDILWTNNRTRTRLNAEIVNRAYNAIDFLIKKGLTAAQAVGVMANAVAESGVNPDIDKKHGLGIFQWIGPRRNMYLKMKNTLDGSNSLEKQLSFMLHELNTSEGKAKSALTATKTPEAAAYAFMDTFERPADRAGQWAIRKQIAAGLKKMLQ